jgi:hypothetical protein
MPAFQPGLPTARHGWEGLCHNLSVKASIVCACTSVLLGLTLLSACKKDIQSKDAVRNGVLKYLSQRSDLAAMDVSVSAVTFKGDEAEATVHFQAKGNTAPGAGLTMPYVLERKGNEWVVKGKSGNSQHGMGATGMPGGGGGESLPPGHPVVPPGGASPGGGPPSGAGGPMPPLPTLPDHPSGDKK